MHIVACSASAAKAAGDEWMDDDSITHCNVADCRSDFVDPPGILVTECIRQFHPRFLCPLPLDDMQIGPAQASAANPHHHVERSRHLRLWHFLDPGLLMVF